VVARRSCWDSNESSSRARRQHWRAQSAAPGARL